MSYQVRYTGEARADLISLYQFLPEQDPSGAGRALETIRKGADMLESFPFTSRKVDSDNPYLRELVVPFGNTGHVALFEIEGEAILTILAVRHQREDDYYQAWRLVQDHRGALVFSGCVYQPNLFSRSPRG